jgi:hypothetical protein
MTTARTQRKIRSNDQQEKERECACVCGRKLLFYLRAPSRKVSCSWMTDTSPWFSFFARMTSVDLLFSRYVGSWVPSDVFWWRVMVEMTVVSQVLISPRYWIIERISKYRLGSDILNNTTVQNKPCIVLQTVFLQSGKR